MAGVNVGVSGKTTSEREEILLFQHSYWLNRSYHVSVDTEMARVDASEGFSCIVLLLWPSRKHGSSSHVRYTEILGIFPVANKIQITQPDVPNAQWRKMTGLVDDTFWPL